MSIEIEVPFTLDPLTGKVRQITDPDAQQMQHVLSLVSTQTGERVMRPDYGIPLSSYVFQPGANVIAQEIATDVQQQMARWERGLILDEVMPVSDDNFGVARVDVSFESSPEATGITESATVNVGGTVT